MKKVLAMLLTLAMLLMASCGIIEYIINYVSYIFINFPILNIGLVEACCVCYIKVIPP